ncbi:MAG: hypothetical protein O3B75_05195 [Planctomycetota bacterium]|nr:hypothetical protein [Planctomycetota bacterium]
MKTITVLMLCSSLVLLVGCGSDTSSTEGATAKPALKQPIPDSPKANIGVESSTDAPAGVKKNK